LLNKLFVRKYFYIDLLVTNCMKHLFSTVGPKSVLTLCNFLNKFQMKLLTCLYRLKKSRGKLQFLKNGSISISILVQNFLGLYL